MGRKGITISVSVLTAIFAFAFSSHAVWFWHYYHMTVIPEDLFAPAISGNFEFYTKGFSREYDFCPKYRDIYELSVTAPNNTISSGWGKDQKEKDIFNGKLKIEIFANGAKLSENIAANWERATFQSDNLDYITSYSLFYFPIPINNFQIQKSKIRITVVEPYNFFEQYKNDTKLEIQVAAID